MNTLPSWMVNRWERRVEPRAGEGWLYWHILFKDHPQVQDLASIAQEKISDLSGLHFTPRQWLHITTCIPGPARDFAPSKINDMVNEARRLLSGFPPVTISLGRILYHPEAIALDIKPRDALDPARKAIWQATSVVASASETAEHRPWIPHITLAYSTSGQSAQPIIDALGRELPPCEAVVNSVNLVVQEGAERLWNWRILEEISFEAPSNF